MATSIVPAAVLPAAGQADLMSQYIAWLDTSALTVRAHKHALKVWGRWLAEQGIAAPCRADVLAYRQHLTEAYAAGTARSYFTAVRLLYRWASTEGLYPNIADIKGVKVQPHQGRDSLTAEQARMVLTYAREHATDERGLRDYAILALMLACGLRTVEVVRANVRHLRALGGQTVLYVQGKGHSSADDFVRVPVEVERLIRQYLAVRPDVMDDDPLFASTSRRNPGQRLTTTTISTTTKAIFKANGLSSSRITAHSCRHTAVTLALLGGVSLQEVSQFARHSHLSTTLIYAHNLERAANKGSAAVASQIF